MYILSADFGTSSIKMAVMNEKTEILKRTKIEYNYDVIDKHKIQLDAEIIYGAFLKGLNSFAEYLNKIDVIAPCVMAPTLIPMDREGNPLYPAILHLDRRSYRQSKFALKAVGKENFININGNLPFAGGISCTTMLWIKDNLPELYKSTYKFGHLNTFLHRRLVGRWLIDPSNASFTGLYETLESGGWSEEITGALGIDQDKLPEIVPSKSFAGRLSARAAAETGLREGTPVVMGANDSTSAAYGAGVVNHGDILNISGSSEILVIISEKPIPNEYYCIRTSMELDKWIILAITVGGFAIEWFRKEFYPDMERDEFYEDYLQKLVEERVDRKPDVKFRPHLAGDRHSLAKKKAAFTGLTFETTRDDCMAGLLYGTYEPVLRTMDICKDYIDFSPIIYWTGGLVSEAYMRYKKSVFKGFNFEMKKNCTMIGNAKVAAELMGK